MHANDGLHILYLSVPLGRGVNAVFSRPTDGTKTKLEDSGVFARQTWLPAGNKSCQVNLATDAEQSLYHSGIADVATD